ncbi:aerotolerance protein BatD [Elizabethkingia argentiflava]|uniref:Aerotolerance protein BatD n=1 Tax=Elizabethkingia argenteiflava TaxID=2681556 RepID=A0A845PVS5_9FLAO|nr:BatD family protein [Elizabethkingia argenteiflava]NAW50210.1 aerotolerance protein BatD [Elizabethkingia argenteiflava]
MSRMYFYILFLLAGLHVSAQVEMSMYVEDKGPLKIGQEIPIVFMATSKSSSDIQMKLPYFDPKKYDISAPETSREYYLDERKGVELTRFSALVVVRPKVSGVLRIGSALAKVDNVIYKTDTKEIFVKNEKFVENKPQLRSNNEVYIRTHINAQNVYVNEAVMAIVTAYSKNMNSLDNIEEVQFSPARSVRYYKVGDTNGEIDHTADEYSMKMAVYLLFPEISGKTILPPVEAKVVQGGTVSKIKSNRVKLNVKPLPDNAPADFQNAVGQYKAKVSMKTLGDLEINKPISIQVKLSGVGNLKEVQLPKFIESEAYRIYKPKITYNLKTAGDLGFKGDVTADYLVIPKKYGKCTIALEPFSYFDPQFKEYKIENFPDLPIFIQRKEAPLPTPSKEVKTGGDRDQSVAPDVNIPVIAQVDVEHRYFRSHNENISPWLLLVALLLVALFLYFFYKIYNSNKASSPTGKHYSPHFKLTTNVSETEHKLLKEMRVDIPTHLKYLENLISQKDYSKFFIAYSDMQKELEDYTEFHYQTTFLSYLSNHYDADILEKVKNLQSQINIVKFSPLQEESIMQQLFTQIYEVYIKIEE